LRDVAALWSRPARGVSGRDDYDAGLGALVLRAGRVGSHRCAPLLDSGRLDLRGATRAVVRLLAAARNGPATGLRARRHAFVSSAPVSDGGGASAGAQSRALLPSG